MPGAAAANFLVTGVGRIATAITHRRGVHARQLPEDPLRPPEATHTKHHLLKPFREWGFKRSAGHDVLIAHRDGLCTTRQRLFWRGHLWYASREQHDGQPPSGGYAYRAIGAETSGFDGHAPTRSTAVDQSYLERPRRFSRAAIFAGRNSRDRCRRLDAA